MDTREQIKQMQQTIDTLQAQVLDLSRKYESLRHASDMDPDIIRAIGLLLFKPYDDVVTDYDRPVNEGGASSYTVPAIYNGLIRIGDKVFGWYNPV